MSSTLIRRIAALLVATVIPLGAAAADAHADTWSPQARVITAGDGDTAFVAFSFDRSSWS